MKKVYPALIHREKDGLWLEFPDLPGCYTDGENIEELLTNAEEALGLYLAVKIDYNESFSSPSDINDIDGEEKTYVTVDVNKYHKDTKAVKKMLSIPAWLAKEADDRNYSLSKILQDALLQKLES